LLLSTYKQENALSEMFHVGLLLGSASLVVGQSILLLLTVAFSLIVLRTGNWREWVVFLLGIAMTAVFVLMVTIWNENPITSFQTVVQTAWVGSFSVDKPSAGHAALFFLIVLSAGSVLKDVTVGTVSERNITMTNVGWALGIALMVAVLGLGWQAGLILAAFPLSSFIANGIERNSRWWLQDLLLILLIAAPVLSSLWLF
ncbi:MAG: hypothetical protein RL266_1679, partial [Bacteroidota bacterium]